MIFEYFLLNDLRTILGKHCLFHDGPNRDKDTRQRARESPYRCKMKQHNQNIYAVVFEPEICQAENEFL